MELPSEDTLRFLVRSYAEVRAGYGELFGGELVQPTGEWFPDEIEASPEGVRRILARVKSYAPLSEDLPVELGGFVEDEGAGAGGGCGSGGCSPGAAAGAGAGRGGVVETREGYQVLVHVGDVREPALLVASLCRAVGTIVLAEGEDELDPRDAAALSEVMGVAMGMGVLLTAAACVYKKGCGGMRMHQGTLLGVEDLAVLLALYARVHGVKPGVARAHLETTQTEAFDVALRWVDSNDEIVTALREHPETLADGLFRIEPTKGLLGRIFKKKSAPLPDAALAAKGRERSEAEAKRLREVRALVDEALSD